MNAARGLLSTVLATLCALAAVFAFGDVAQAAVTHKYLSSPITEIPAKGPPPAEETVAYPGPLGGVSSMTVDSGDLYLVRSGDLLDKFDASTGAFIAQLPQPASPYYDFHQGVAVGHGAGETEVYVGGDENGSEIQGRVAVYDAAGHIRGYWTGSDTPAGHFGCFECGGYGGVAADDSGNLLTKGLVYVVDPLNDVVDVFAPQAGGGEKYVAQITGPEPGVTFASLGGALAASVAVDQANGDVLVVEGTTVVDVFEPTALGEYTLVRRLTGTAAGPFERISGVTADGASGDVYVWEAERQVVDQFSSTSIYLGHLTGTSNTPAGAFGSPNAVAVDPASGDVYVGDTQRNINEEPFASVHIFGPNVVVPDVATEPASSVRTTAATLNGTVNPDEAGTATCRFEWGTSSSFDHIAPCEPEAVANGNAPVAVHATLGGLQADTTYHYRLVASDADGTNAGEASQDREFATPGPGIHQESASSVTSESATLGAAIDPDSAPTTYYFQYGTSTAYGSDLPLQPGREVGSGKGDVAVSVHPQGLVAGTVYHYRAVALSNVEGTPVTVAGPDQTFATQAAGTEITQPDDRQWEMVSPPNKQGAEIVAVGNETGDDIQAAADGSGITYGANSSIVANPAGNRSPDVVQALSTRGAPGDWTTADLSTIHNEGATVPALLRSEYRLFSDDLSLGVLTSPGPTPLPPLPPTTEASVYLRAANGEYKATVTSADLQSPGDKLETREAGVGFVSASPDLRHLVLDSPVALVPGAPAGGGLYEWSEGSLQLVSVTPNHELISNAYLGNIASYRGGDPRKAVSDDGSRIVWEDEHGRYYLRDTVKGETVSIDAAQGAPEPGARRSIYRTANSEGSRIFFTSTARLTANSTASELSQGNREDLYVFEVTSGNDEALAGKPIDLTVDANNEETADVLGVIGASEDGSYVYFVANGVLGDGAEHGARHGNCTRGLEAASQQSCNLYVEHYDDGAKAWTPPHWIAALSGDDSPTWGDGDSDLIRMTSRVSPDGGYLAFMSERSLTGYENRDANSDVADEEVYLYDASAARLVCASCNPTGARPAGIFRGTNYQERLVSYTEGLWSNRWLAGNIPGWTTDDNSSALYQSRYLSDSGRLFFNSSDALVPADVNGVEDVYEYEPAGVGSCQGATHGQSASVVYVGAGCVALISAGTSSEESAFMDASESGGDVFFLTLSKLAPQDYDTSIDLYDAHECTSAAPCAPAPTLTRPPCTTGDACKPAPTSQPILFGAPSSETFSGAGNVTPTGPVAKATSRSSQSARKLAKALKACRGKRKHQRVVCERRARKRYGTKPPRSGKSLSAKTTR
jgi:hypothetical protein